MCEFENCPMNDGCQIDSKTCTVLLMHNEVPALLDAFITRYRQELSDDPINLPLQSISTRFPALVMVDRQTGENHVICFN